MLRVGPVVTYGGEPRTYPDYLAFRQRNLDRAVSVATSLARDLARELHAPLLIQAITGTPDQVRTATSLVRLAVYEYGTAAPRMLDELASSARDAHLAVNLSRSSSALEGHEGTLRKAHRDQWQAWLREVRGSTPPTPPRRRR